MAGGRTITVVAHKVLRDFWAGQKYTPPGVQWGDATSLQVTYRHLCLLHVCGGSNAVFTSATLTSLQVGGNPPWRLAVCVSGGSTITFRNSSFTFPKEGTPPSLFHDDTSVLLRGIAIHNNSVTTSAGACSPSAGIDVEDASLSIVSTTIAANTGVFSGAISAVGAAQLRIQDTTFAHNSGNDGGAVGLKGQAYTVLRGGHCRGNWAQGGGGCLFLKDQAQVQIVAGTGKVACQAGTGKVACQTGVWAAASVSRKIVMPRSGRIVTRCALGCRRCAGAANTVFINNTARYEGGDIAATMNPSVNIKAAIFHSSRANLGGSLCLSGNSTASVSSSAFKWAHATFTFGGAMFTRGNAHLDIKNSTVSGCSAAMPGGALAALGNSTISLLKTTVTGGRAVKQGGFAYLFQQSLLMRSLIKLVDSEVSGRSTLDLGLSLSENAGVQLINSTISNSAAGVRDSEQARNAQRGGVALWDAARMVLEGSEISGNYAQYAAGGLYLGGNATVTFQGSTPSNNTARTTGGGVRLAFKLPLDALLRFVKVEGNAEPNSPDVSVIAIHQSALEQR